MSNLPIYQIYLDESSQTKHRYLTIGCLVVDRYLVPLLEEAVLHAKALDMPNGEMKWTKVSATMLHAYKLVADQFFDLETFGRTLDFHTLVMDTSKRNDHAFNDGSRELGFNKEVYQLLRKCAVLYPDAHFHVTADYRETPYSLEELRKILNNGAPRDHAGGRRDPFRRVQFGDSKKVIGIQLVDLMLGATSYQINGHHCRVDASPARVHLSSYVLERAKIRDPLADTLRAGKFTIWHRKLQQGGPAGPRPKKATG